MSNETGTSPATQIVFLEKKVEELEAKLETLTQPSAQVPEDNDGIARWAEGQGAQVAWANAEDMHHLITVTPPELRKLINTAPLSKEYGGDMDWIEFCPFCGEAWDCEEVQP